MKTAGWVFRPAVFFEPGCKCFVKHEMADLPTSRQAIDIRPSYLSSHFSQKKYDKLLLTQHYNKLKETEDYHALIIIQYFYLLPAAFSP